MELEQEVTYILKLSATELAQLCTACTFITNNKSAQDAIGVGDRVILKEVAETLNGNF
jgi:hypothetical protein